MLASETAAAWKMRITKFMRLIFPTWTLALLVGIGIVDLISTAVLHAHGLITEQNPLMRVFIEQSEWLFAFVKGLTIGAAWGAMIWYAQQNLSFVKKACGAGAGAYLALWIGWFLSG